MSPPVPWPAPPAHIAAFLAANLSMDTYNASCCCKCGFVFATYISLGNIQPPDCIMCHHLKCGACEFYTHDAPSGAAAAQSGGAGVEQGDGVAQGVEQGAAVEQNDVADQILGQSDAVGQGDVADQILEQSDAVGQGDVPDPILEQSDAVGQGDAADQILEQSEVPDPIDVVDPNNH